MWPGRYINLAYPCVTNGWPPIQLLDLSCCPISWAISRGDTNATSAHDCRLIHSVCGHGNRAPGLSVSSCGPSGARVERDVNLIASTLKPNRSRVLFDTCEFNSSIARTIDAFSPPFWKNEKTDKAVSPGLISFVPGISPKICSYWSQLNISVGWFAGPRAVVPMNAAVEVATPSIGLDPLGISSIYTPGCWYVGTATLSFTPCVS